MAKMKLQPRERMVVIIGVIGVIVIGGYGVAQGPYQTYVRSNDQLQQAKERFKLAQAIQATVQKERAKQQQILAKLPKAGGFNLFTEVEKAVKDLKLGPRCAMNNKRGMAARGQESSSVEVTLNGVSNKELVDLLHRVYDTRYIVFLSQLKYLKPSADKKSLDCQMTFVAPQA
jgi:hypothetical protein